MRLFTCVSILALVLAAAPAQKAFGAEQKNAANQSVQEQINDLRSKQDQILQQLQEIRTLLTHQQPSAPKTQFAPSFLSVNVHGEPFRGGTNTRVAVLEYSDFDCSSCAEFATQVFPRLAKEYIDTGKVKFFFRDLPADGDASSLLKSKVARCASEQGKFWTMHEYWFARPQPITDADVNGVAANVGLDTTKLRACLTSDKYAPAIQASIASAQRMQVYGTPAFLIGVLSPDGSFLRAQRVFVGAQDFEFFKKKIEELLVVNTPKPTSSVP